ncbi:hypothetical protein IW261DRAFT_1473595 [Armillaria novae-zelandiae]|uniref:Uncharacterized protein n=1 Tax=Armillaria novae-zelandiae TaxID=153914 RepID=A0AA39PAH0_9AGAR|nr:hypothetical protein IW261DRAFT_1473595 [Armillaria novae-zelandiae]
MLRGAGSRSSPIFISDDEFDTESLQSAPDFAPLVQDQANAYPEKLLTADNHASHSQQSSNSQPTGRAVKKLKVRAVAPAPHPVAGPSKSTNLNTAQQSESKKRKREQRAAKRRQEHTEKKARVDGSAQLMAQAMATFPPSFPALSPTTDMSSRFFMPPDSLVYPPFPYQGFLMGQSLNVSTSNWVNSMASIAEPPPSTFPPTWNIYSDISQWPQISPSSGAQTRPTPGPVESPPPPSSSLSLPLSSTSSSFPDPPRLSLKPEKPKKQSTTMIGMQSDRDPGGKRRTFRIKPTTHMDADLTVRFPYKPDPSRTLVMEQIPKIHRNTNYIRNWCKTVCDCSPIFVAVEASNANAVIEFPSVELARRAWVSPRLGPPNSSGVTIKGAPREDLIRVWWYLVSEPVVEYTMKELEDGEIEDVAALKEAAKKEAAKEAQLQSRREKKRAKKAGKEAEEKLVSEKANHAGLPQVHSPAPTPVHSTAYPPTSVSSPPPSAFAPFPPAPYHPLPSAPPLAPIPQIPVTETFQQKIPLPPQSELAPNWRTAPIDITKISTFHGDPVSSLIAVSSVDTSDMGPPSAKQYTPLGSRSASQSEDMDIDIDMEVETPSSYHNPSPLLSYERGSVPRASDEDTASISPATVTSSTSIHSRIPPSTLSIPTHLSDSIHNLPTPVPTPSNLGSPAASASPTPPPSEPRAMKNAPKGPSFVFRSMAVKQKELEERIARERQSIGVGKMDDHLAAPPPPVSEQVIDNMAMEEKLRQLVLASQRKKLKSTLTPSVEVLAPPVAPQPPEDISIEPAAEVTPLSTALIPSVSRSSEAASPVSDRALDDLAVSFITETIQTLKTPRERPIATPQYRPSATQATAAKQELAAKQRRLEQQIAESRTLMAKLSLARTKQEKDAIMKLLRETSRAAEEDRIKSAKPTKSSWPEATWNGILIVSDDEDDVDSDDEGLL